MSTDPLIYWPCVVLLWIVAICAAESFALIVFSSIRRALCRTPLDSPLDPFPWCKCPTCAARRQSGDTVTITRNNGRGS